jgi:hypothetical protein
MNNLKTLIILGLILFIPVITWAQNIQLCRGSGNLHMFKVNYILNGKVKDLDTNFKINIYNHDSLIFVAHSYSILVESDSPGVKFERLSSLISFPVIKLDSLGNL